MKPLRENFVKTIFVLLGIGVQVPWNAFISAKPYFESRLCSGTGGTKENFELLIGFVFNGSSVLSLVSVIACQWLGKACGSRYFDWSGNDRRDDDSSNGANEIEGRDRIRSFWVVAISLGIYVAVFLLTDILVAIQDIPTLAFKVITLLCLAVCGICSAFTLSGIAAYSGKYPQHVGLNHFMSGQAAGGVVVSVANLMSSIINKSAVFWDSHCDLEDDSLTGTLEDDSLTGTLEDDSLTDTLEDESLTGTLDASLTGASVQRLLSSTDTTCVPYTGFDGGVFLYFLLGAVVLVCCIMGFLMIDAEPISEPTNGYILLDVDEIEDGATSDSSSSSEEQAIDASTACLTVSNTVGQLQSNDSLEDLEAELASPSETVLQDFPDKETTLSSIVEGPALSVFLTLLFTFSLYPSRTSELKSVYQCNTDSRLANDLYTPMTFVIFNVGDLCGRILASHVNTRELEHVSSKLVLGSCLRFFLIVLLLFCATADSDIMVPSDLYSLLVQGIFAISHGFLLSLSFLHAQHKVSETPALQQSSSEILTLALYLGRLSGSILSFPLSNLN